MRHLLIPGEIEPGETVELSTSDSHYLLHVLRRKSGDELVLLDRNGSLFTARLVVRGGAAAARVIAKRDAAEKSAQWSGTITVYQAVPKGRRFDEIIRQVVQGGATSVVPIFTERTIVQPRDNDTARLERWRRIAREAVQQSGAETPVQILPPAPLADLVSAPDGASFFLHTMPLAQGTLHGYLVEVPTQVELVVGPEGGFTDAEIALLAERGFRPLHLGTRVLRTETAAVFALGAVRTVLEERRAWRPID